MIGRRSELKWLRSSVPKTRAANQSDAINNNTTTCNNEGATMLRPGDEPREIRPADNSFPTWFCGLTAAHQGKKFARPESRRSRRPRFSGGNSIGCASIHTQLDTTDGLVAWSLPQTPPNKFAPSRMARLTMTISLFFRISPL